MVRPGKPGPATNTAAQAARRLVNPRTLMLLALLALGAVLAAPRAQADTQDEAVQRGIAAFQAGVFGTALEELLPPAKAGDADAAYWVGRMYEYGLGVPKDIDTAVTWYRKSAEAGLTEAKLRLGDIYFQGTDELQDFAEARKWLEQAAYDGSVRAQRDLGDLYAKGEGVKRDPVWAYVWYELAATKGDYEAARLRDRLLNTMAPDEITEAQNLARETAPEVFGEVQDQPTQRQLPPAKGGSSPGDGQAESEAALGTGTAH